jgi:hypothetical protein
MAFKTQAYNAQFIQHPKGKEDHPRPFRYNIKTIS